MHTLLAEKHSDVSRFITNKLKSYLQAEYDYIEYPEDLEDIELAMCPEDLIEETYSEAMEVIKDYEDSYDIEIVDKEEFDEDLYCLIEDIFYKVRDEEADKYREKFEMENMVSEMEEYSDEW